MAAIVGELRPLATHRDDDVDVDGGTRGDRASRVGRQHEAGKDRQTRLVGARERGGFGACALGLGGVRQTHDGAVGALVLIGADHRKSFQTAATAACTVSTVTGSWCTARAHASRLSSAARRK